MEIPSSSAVPPASFERYVPSGRVSPTLFLPLLAVACLVARACGLLLAQAYAGDFYYILITPLVVSVPVFFANWAALRIGRCRNPALGTFACTATPALFFFSFLDFTLRSASGGGAPLSLESFMRIADPLAVWEFFVAIVGSIEGWSFGAEALLLAAIGAVQGIHLGSRVYFEETGEWSRCGTAMFRSEDFFDLVECIDREDWEPLPSFERVSATDRAGGATILATLALEYARDDPDAPAYVTLAAMGFRPAMKKAGTLTPWGIPYILKRRIEAESARELTEAVPDLRTSGLAALASFAKAPKGGEAGVAEGDFREAAARSSRALVEAQTSFRFDKDLDASLCLPTPGGAGRLRAFRRAALSGFVLLGAAFAAMLGGAALLAKAENVAKAAGSEAALPWNVAGGILGGGGLLSLLFVFPLARSLAVAELSRRPGSVLPWAPASGARYYCNIEDAATFHRLKVFPEDVAVCCFDPARRRVLIEGYLFRYVARAADVEKLEWRAKGGESGGYALLAWRVGEARVEAAISPQGLRAALGARYSKRFVEELRAALEGRAAG